MAEFTGEFTASWVDIDGTHTTNYSKSNGLSVDPSLPIVILLHGKKGNRNHWAAPDISPGCNLDETLPPRIQDLGWKWACPILAIGPISVSPSMSVTSWQNTLNALGYVSVNYDQIDPNGLLARPTIELGGVVQAVLKQFGPKRVAFLCHSRGGLLLRRFLQDNRSDVTLLSQIAGAVTLHTPHQGSQAADLAAEIHNAIVVNRFIYPFLPLYQLALDSIDSLVDGDAISELETSSQFLTKLRADEAVPLPISIPIHTFGGTNPSVMNVTTSMYDAMSWVPQWHWPPFHWKTLQSNLSIPDGLAGFVAPEERVGGDTLVTDDRSHLPAEASHHTNPVNHAAALWDERIKAQVEPILRSWAARPGAIYLSLREAFKTLGYPRGQRRSLRGLAQFLSDTRPSIPLSTPISVRQMLAG